MKETITVSSRRGRRGSRLIYPVLLIFFIMFAVNAYAAAVGLNYTTVDIKKKDVKLKHLASGSSIYFKNLTLYDTGYDQNGGGVKGSYYYALQDQNLLLFFLSEKESGGKKELKNYDLRTRLIKDDKNLSLLTEKIAKDLSWSYKELRSISLPYIASGPDANYFKTILSLAFSGIGLFAAFICFVLSILKKKNRKRSKTAGLR